MYVVSVVSLDSKKCTVKSLSQYTHENLQNFDINNSEPKELKSVSVSVSVNV